MLVLWILGGIGGLVLAITASRRTVHHASVLAFGSRLPPFVVGITLLAVGTDLPEMANSIVASVRGHGDLNVSDSMGSTATQITLVLGLLPLVAGAIITGRRRVRVVGGLTAMALGVGILMVSDGRLSRVDGIVLVLLWVVASLVAWRLVPASSEPVLPVPSHHKMRHLGLALGGLALVGAGSWAAVEALVRVAEGISVPLYIVGFVGAALGTSLPELIVDVTALRSGQRDLAIGDVFGSSLVDATLSIGIGPIVAPTFVDQALGVRGGLVALAAVALVTILLGLRRRHTRWTGVVLIAMYVAMTIVISTAG